MSWKILSCSKKFYDVILIKISNRKIKKSLKYFNLYNSNLKEQKKDGIID